MLAALQRGVPIARRPFEELSRACGWSEAELIAFVAKCREEGMVRRFGAVFDARRMGYRSALCAARVPEPEISVAAARVSALAGVTHCYRRVPRGARDPACPNLWFTLSYPRASFDAAQADAEARLAPHPVRFLPATKRYKVDVVFGGAARERDESVEDALPPLDARERAIVRALQGDTVVRADYFAALAERLGEKEWRLLSTLELWRRQGRLKRIGLLLRHREAGWTANGMCCWRIAGDTADAGRALAARGEVTHCYERASAPEFQYNLFAMVHARSEGEAEAQFAALDAVVRAAAGDRAEASTMLLSTKEYKKTSLAFFA
ncbi:MAG: hypothetical protein MJ138_04385 [Kiritimatiellae bacterium]|nr:hypothetical protein [Kiritimatiellia bacterium]